MEVPELKRAMSMHHTAAAAEWLKDKDVGTTAMVAKLYTFKEPSRCYLTVWLEKTGPDTHVEKRLDGNFQTDCNTPEPASFV